VFLTSQALVKADRDNSYDLYSHGPSGIRLVSVGPAGGNMDSRGGAGSLDGAVFPNFGGLSDDGRRVFFTTQERLVRDDRNRSVDLYARTPGGVKLLSAR
jgi:hypothetical protein